MRALACISLLMLGFAACTVVAKTKKTAPPGAPVAAAGEKEAPEWLRPAVPPEVRDRHLAERFPGAKQLELVKVMWWPEPRTGACWSELPTLDKTAVEAEYALEGESSHHRESGPKALTTKGWTRVYRAPQGEGLERQATFRSLELSVVTELSCRCAPGSVMKEGEKTPVKLRFRWAAGGIPEISGRVGEPGRTKGLTPILTFGKLVTYDFPVKATFPDRAPGDCGAHVALTVLIEPPIL